MSNHSPPPPPSLLHHHDQHQHTRPCHQIHLCPTIIKQSFIFFLHTFLFSPSLSPPSSPPPPPPSPSPRGATAPAQASPGGGHWLTRGQRPVAILAFEEAEPNGEASASRRPMGRPQIVRPSDAQSRPPRGVNPPSFYSSFLLLPSSPPLFHSLSHF